MKKIKEMCDKYKEIIAYLFFGMLTIVVNLIAYYICAHIFILKTIPSTVIAWFCAVVFAFIANKLWVFKCKSESKSALYKEITNFFVYRVLTGLLDILIMYVFVDKLLFYDMIVKILSNILVIILNYLASKFVIFRKK